MHAQRGGIVRSSRDGVAVGALRLAHPAELGQRVREVVETEPVGWLELQRASNYGNAASVFTTNGAVARRVAERAGAGMVGVNIGVPVPREPFSFGGTKDSRFGSGDITGRGAVELWTHLKKITTKWQIQEDANWMS